MMGAEESGGFGFGMHLPERDGVYADLLLLDLFLRERAAGRWPVSSAIGALPRDRRAVAGTCASTSMSSARSTPRPSGGCSSTSRPRRRPSSPASRSPGRAARHRRRLQVLPRRRVVAAHPGVRAPSRSSASTPRRRPPSCGTRCSSPASGWCAARERPRRRTRRAPRRQAVGPRAHLGPHGSLRRQDPRHRGRPAAVAPAPRDQGRVDPRAVGPPAAVRSRTTTAWSGPRSSGRASTGASPTGRVHRFEAIERCELIEVSTPELDDVIRLEDDFGREGTNAPIERVHGTISGVTGAPAGCTLRQRDRHHRSRCMTGRRPRERPIGRRR